MLRGLDEYFKHNRHVDKENIRLATTSWIRVKVGIAIME